MAMAFTIRYFLPNVVAWRVSHSGVGDLCIASGTRQERVASYEHLSIFGGGVVGIAPSAG